MGEPTRPEGQGASDGAQGSAQPDDSGDPGAVGETSQRHEALREKSRRRTKLAEVFGDDLPTQTRDDRDQGHSLVTADWYRENRPPHYE